VLSTATFLDTGGATITRSGAVGYRTRNAGVADTRAVYDNLVVTNHSPDLLWYDSFYDDTSPRISAYYAGGIVKYWADNGQFHLNGEDAPGTAAAMIDLPDYTDDPEWENVETKARLRIGNSTSDMVVGLANRAQGVDFTTGEGAFYYFGITGDNDANPFAALYRVVDGVATDPPLAYAPISTTVEGTNLYLSFETVTNGDGNVELTAIASKSTDLSSPFAELTYTDSSVDKLIGPGTAGMVMSKTAASSGELYNSNFDFFTVRLIPEPSTALLLLAAGLVLAGIRRQR
jgi:hypothetical protein